MATTERYITVIELNSEQAKRNLDALRKEVEKYELELSKARQTPGNTRAIDEAKRNCLKMVRHRRSAWL